MDILSIVWNVSPYVYRFSETYAIRWYGILFALAFVLSYYVAYYICRKENFSERTVNIIAIASVLGGVIGEGGMASHGGALGVLIAIFFISKKELPYKTILARILLVVPLAGVFFRMGNLMNSEIYGTATNLPWGFVFVQSPEVLRGVEQAVPRHPTQIYEMICYVSLFAVYMVYCWKRLTHGKSLSDSFIIGMFGVWVFGGRFLIEFLKMPQVNFEQGLPLNMGQILSLPFIVWGVIALWNWQHKKS